MEKTTEITYHAKSMTKLTEKVKKYKITDKKDIPGIFKTLPTFYNLMIVTDKECVVYELTLKYIFDGIRMTKKRLEKFEENFHKHKEGLINEDFKCYDDGTINDSFIIKLRELLLKEIK